MSTIDTNARYEAIVDAALTFFTILVGLKLADLIDPKGPLGVDKWPCFITGVAVFLRYVTGSFDHQRTQHVNQPEQHDVRFLFDVAFLIAFGVIAVWACVAAAVPAFLDRLIVFTETALGWTLVYFAFALVAKWSGKAYTFKYLWWVLVNFAQFGVLYVTKIAWQSSHPTVSVLGVEFRWLWILSALSVLLLFADLCLQLTFNPPPPMRSHAASHGAASSRIASTP